MSLYGLWSGRSSGSGEDDEIWMAVEVVLLRRAASLESCLCRASFFSLSLDVDRRS